MSLDKSILLYEKRSLGKGCARITENSKSYTCSYFHSSSLEALLFMDK